MKLHDLKPQEGSKKDRKRVGRGIAAGQGRTAGRGQKGQGRVQEVELGCIIREATYRSIDAYLSSEGKVFLRCTGLPIMR